MQQQSNLKAFLRSLRKLTASAHDSTRLLVKRTFNQPRRIKLIGWHGYGATGDDLLELCVKQVLAAAARERGVPLEFIRSGYADLIVVGGGTLLGFDSMDIYGHVMQSRSPLVFFGGGFRREQRSLHPSHQQRFLELANRSVLKGVRGYGSQQLLIQNSIFGFEVIGDPAFQFHPVPTETLSGKFKVGVAVRSMGKTGEQQYVSNDEMFGIIANICDYLIEQHNAELFFMDFAENSQDSDREGAQQTIARMQYGAQVKAILPIERDPVQAFSRIGELDYVVSQRLHPTLIAWLLRIPCVALDYQFLKVADFMGSIGMSEFVIRTDEFHLDIYEKKHHRILAERDLIIEQSQRSISYWIDRQLDFARRAIELIA